MATKSLDPEPREHQRRRLPKLLPPEPVGVSSDETPRAGTSDESARQRRRNQQRITRERTPDSTEILSPIPKRESTLPPRAEDSDQKKAAKRRKARRRAQSTSQLSPEPSILQGFEDEIIVESSRKKATSTLPDLLLSSNFGGTAPSKSAPTPRVYFENKKSFSSVNKDTAAARLADPSGSSPFSLGYNENFTIKQQTADTLKRFTVQVAKQTHAGIQRFFVFIHGINAGYALWMCIFVYVFSQGSNQTFFDTYRSIALITHVLFYLFLAFCLVDVLDRIDPVKFDRTTFLESISLQNSALAILFYAVAMTVNLVMIRTEDGLRMISFTANNTNQTTQFLQDVINSSGDQWKQLTAVRAAFCVAGWFIASIHVNKDRLRTMIKNTEENAFYQELNVEQNAVPLDGRINSA